ncbi:hypothetical protein [Paenibacillus sp.]|uniref:hypothetical protein n=1 Tax=Paenibacillus sp. TaxID=58172 RepID=UPI002D355FD4|nr:hypothetical protein [Paenibacillus sp.]HZG84642.1 hypothetical protein [Paenibacillus sp.]
MKLTNLLQLTEHHTFVAVRRFGLSPLDSRMLWSAYQPLIGGTAAAFYMTLCSLLPSDASGASEAGTLGQLFLACGLEPNERGRKRLVEETSKLEAVGLLRTFRLLDGDEVTGYEFRLEPPLTPEKFFGVHHLWLLLQEKLGPSAAETVRRSFVREGWSLAPGERREELSAPFYEVFRLHVPAAAAVEEAPEPVPTAPPADPEAFGRDGFRSDELLRRFPRSSPHRRAVERLLADAGRLAKLNYIAGRYELTLKQTVSLLDEDGMFDASGAWQEARFEARAAEMYRGSNAAALRKERTARKQELAREEPSAAAEAIPGQERDVPAPYWLEVPEQFQGQCDVRQYNAMLANSPYTRVLKLFFEPSAVPTAVEEAFLAMSVNYRLPDEVLNVMIHYIRANDLDWKRNYLDAIAANVAGKRIRSFEHAVTYFRRAEQTRGGTARGDAAARSDAPRGEAVGAAPREPKRRGRPPAAERPVIPVARSEGAAEATEEDIRRIMEMAKRLTNGG